MKHAPNVIRALVPFLLVAGCGGAEPVHTRGGEAPSSAARAEPQDSADAYLWLEEVAGDRALAWARERNAVSTRELESTPGFRAGRDRIRAIYDSKEKIPFVGKAGKWLYNLWTDADHPRGLYRRTTLAEYRKAEPAWETVLDVDALGKAESTSWVFRGMDCLYPKYERCLLLLSRGGADAVTVREFDVEKKVFVEGGFSLPEGKVEAGWKDIDTLYVGADFGEGSMSASGYPLFTKEWKRGTELRNAPVIFKGEPGDVAASVWRQWDHGKTRDLAGRWITTFTEAHYVRRADGFKRVDVPEDAEVGYWDDQIIVTLRTVWKTGDTTWPAGAALIMSEAAFTAGKRDFVSLFTPTPQSAFDGVTNLETHLLTNELVDVHNELYAWKRTKKGWAKTRINTPAFASFSARAYDADKGDDYWFVTSDFLTPTTLELQRANQSKREVIKRNPAFFDATGLEATQHFATSADGTRVPYFQVSRKGLELDGSHPTILYGYGGFEISLSPQYDPATGAIWLERGGVYVVANIRGGGEYGPTWHQAAVGHDRQRAYDDFSAVARDLVARKVTSPAKLGIHGGSNGGLLMGVMLTKYPDLFGAVFCQQPLLDMKRYHRLLAGASWMGEYGDPDDPADWAAIAKYSPYQNLKPGVAYPRIFFTTSTRDDRVHPGHARKMAARMIEQGHRVLFYENLEGGHRGAADNGQVAYMRMLGFAFLGKELGLQ